MRTVLSIFLLATLVLSTSCMMPDRDKQVKINEAKLAEEGFVPLEVGESAPLIELSGVDGTQLSDGLTPPEGPMLLFFVTALDTPNNTRQVRQLNNAAEELAAAGVRAAIVVPAGSSAAAAYADEHSPRLPVIADESLAVAIAYGCAVEKAEYLQRTEVGIAADGTVLFFERGFPLQNAKVILDRFGITATDS